MSRNVIDVWGGNKWIDVAQWKEAHDLWGVIVRCGGHEYLRDENGVLEPFKTYYRDGGFDQLYGQVVSNDLHVGSYYYSSATTPDEAREEARHCLGLLEGKSFDLPVYMDVEEQDQFALGAALTDVVVAFCEVIEAAGRRAGVYSGIEGFYAMDDVVCRYSLWLALWSGSKPSWATPERGYDMWQQGSMNAEGERVFRDGGAGFIDYDYWYGDVDGGAQVPDIRQDIVEMAKSQIGSWYFSMNYSAIDGWGGMGTHYAGQGWGCAQHASYPYNVLLGTSYVGSCWNFAGDALGQSVNQGGGEWEFTDDPQPGDIVLYIKTGYDGTDYDDYSHAGVYVGDGRAVSALGQGTPYDSNYRGDPDQGWGIQEHSLDYCFRWGTLDDYRFVRCKRLDAAQREPIPEKDKETTQDGDDMVGLIKRTDSKGNAHLYYYDGCSKPFHIDGNQLSALNRQYQRTHGGKPIPQLDDMPEKEFAALEAMYDSIEASREKRVRDVVTKAVDKIPVPTVEDIAQAVAAELGKE